MCRVDGTLLAGGITCRHSREIWWVVLVESSRLLSGRGALCGGKSDRVRPTPSWGSTPQVACACTFVCVCLCLKSVSYETFVHREGEP